jgi:hypothetical protein
MCVDVVGVKGWIEVAEVNLASKKINLKLNIFFALCVYFSSYSLELGWFFTMDALKGRMLKMQKSKLSSYESSICFLYVSVIYQRTKTA